LSGKKLIGVIHARIQVRPATEDDLDSINEICNH